MLFEVALADHKLIKEFFNNPALNEKDPFFYNMLSVLVGKTSILTTSGEAWSSKHKLIQPVFKNMNMESFYFPTILDATEEFIDYLEQYCFNSKKALSTICPTDAIPIDKYTSEVTLDVITRAMFNEKLNIHGGGKISLTEQ
jgi:cytochrome P450